MNPRAGAWLVCGPALALACIAGCAHPRSGQVLAGANTPTFIMKVPFKIGSAVVTAEVTQRGKPQPTMINVHDDENTSVAAGKIVIEQSGGRLIELAHSGRRHVRFTLGGERFAFDPNRMFSNAGIRQTLDRQGRWSEAAQRVVRQFATQYLTHFGLDREPVIMALHNTVDGNFSIKSYLPGAEHAAAVAAMHISEQRSPFDFFYVTDERFFRSLQQRGFNVVLQDNANVADDGSLSVYFGRKGIPYLNIEAAMDHLDAQIEMLRAAREIVDEILFVPRR